MSKNIIAFFITIASISFITIYLEIIGQNSKKTFDLNIEQKLINEHNKLIEEQQKAARQLEKKKEATIKKQLELENLKENLRIKREKEEKKLISKLTEEPIILRKELVPGKIENIKLTPDGKYLAVALSTPNEIIIYDINQMREKLKEKALEQISKTNKR